MKKTMSLIFLIFLVLPLVNAVQYNCPDPSKLQTDTEEIKEGKSDSLRGLHLGICGATSNSFAGYIATTIFIDSNLVIIEGNKSFGTEQVSENITIKASETSSSASKITIGSSSETLDLGDCSLIGDTKAMITDISGTGSTATVNVLVGSSSIILDTQGNPGQIIEFGSKKYAIQLLAGSDQESTIKISTCTEGNIEEVLVVDPTPTNQNQSSQNNETNQTLQNSSTNSTLQNTDSTPQNNSNLNQSANIIEPQQKKKSFFKTFWEWLKSIFS